MILTDGFIARGRGCRHTRGGRSFYIRSVSEGTFLTIHVQSDSSFSRKQKKKKTCKNVHVTMKRGNPWNSLVISSPRSSTKDEVRRYIKIIDFSQISRAFRAINLPLTGPTFFQLRFGRALEKQEESRSFVNRRLEKSNSRAEGNYDFSSSVSFCVRFPWGILIYHVSPRNPACRAATRAISVRSAHSTRRDESQFRENVRGGWIIIQRRRGARLRERVCGGLAARILEKKNDGSEVRKWPSEKSSSLQFC